MKIMEDWEKSGGTMELMEIRQILWEIDVDYR